ncbi:fumarate reductase subunit C, partial [Vibrio parahaemolyticus]|nr:fumarate reductase subunit C [Vibrio parahaemolyticus]
ARSHPPAPALTIGALLGSLFHAHPYFSRMPQVMPIRVKGKPVDKKIIV